MSASDRRASVRPGLALAMAALLAACGSDDTPPPAAGVQAPAPSADGTAPAAGAAAASGAPDVASPPAAATTPAATSFGNRTLHHPEALQMAMLAYRLQGRVPPVAEWAAEQPDVKYANEFERADLLTRETARLQDIFDATADVGRLRMNVNADLSEYDPTRGGFYLDAFMPGSSFDFSVQPAPRPVPAEHVVLSVDNSEELNFWPLDAAAAQDVLARNNGVRNVTLDSQFEIVGVGRRSDGVVISVRLLRYGIISSRYNQPALLGERRFDGAGD